MILSYADKDTETFVKEGICKAGWQTCSKAAARKLDMLDAATVLDELRSPPGNHLEALKGDRKGQWSIRINDQWRICFRWGETGPEDGEVVDYHRQGYIHATHSYSSR